MRVGGDVGIHNPLVLTPRPQVAREGKDVSIFTYSRMRYTAMQAANELAKDGIDCEARDRPGWERPSWVSRPGSCSPMVTCLGHSCDKRRFPCAQVIDLISIKPFDLSTISKSVQKTRRVVIVEECMRTGGIGASLSALINEKYFYDLDHEVVRLSSQDMPTAYAAQLEADTIVQVKDVVAAVRKAVGK